jgi:hypothetical protein
MKVLSFSKSISNRIFQSFLIYLFLGFFFALNFYGMREDIKGIETFFDSVYFSFVTMTTLGYGDILPLSNLAKFTVIMESVAGVVLLGFFLIVVSSEVAYTKERRRIETQKLSFKEQYKIWRENIINVFVSLTNDKSVKSEELYEVSKFRDYFKKDDNRYWYEVMNNLSDNSYRSVFYQKELIHEIEFLQRNIEIFIMQVPIEDVEVIKVLNGYINGLYRLRKEDLSDNDQFRSFMRRLNELIVSYDFLNGEYNKNYLLDAVESI